MKLFPSSSPNLASIHSYLGFFGFNYTTPHYGLKIITYCSTPNTANAVATPPQNSFPLKELHHHSVSTSSVQLPFAPLLEGQTPNLQYNYKGNRLSRWQNPQGILERLNSNL
ncbi:uncharacterized protein H6S33_003356, partial [Morchella sextelata]|uniref:uncharacterized protein n=1 Tax=Morchella sextelata TaxID=1174677 RepID=UPI001D038BAA